MPNLLMPLSTRVHEIGLRLADATSSELNRTLCEGLSVVLGFPYRVTTSSVSDGATCTTTFAAVVYAATDASTTSAQGGIPADNAAAVIEAIDDLDLTSFSQAYARVAVAKRLTKAPAPKIGDIPVSTNTLGIVYAQRASLPIEAFAAELERLNGETPHEQWVDMVVIARVGVINYGVQFPAEGLSGDHLPPAPNAARGKPPPIYVIIAIRPVGDFAFNKMASFLVGHLQLFSPGAALPNFQDLLVGMSDTGIVCSGYQFNMAGALVPVPPQFRNDRYFPPPALRIENAKDGLLATIQLLPWQEGGVIFLRGNKLPLEGLLVFLDPEVLTTTAVFRRPNDTQLSYVLPISQKQFVAFLQRFQRQSNMVVRASKDKWTARKLADEGASSPFMARLLMGVMRIRDVAFQEGTRKSFDDVYETLSTALISARDTAREIAEIWRAHNSNVSSGTCVRRSPHTLHIDENVDRELRRLTESFLNATARSLKHGLQELAKVLGCNLGFWFQKEPSFKSGVTHLTNHDAALADYLSQSRAIWSETLMLRRNAVEHEGWTLPKVAYRDEADKVAACEPLVDGKPVTEFVEFMLDRLCCTVEDLVMHLLSTRLPMGIGLHEIPPERRPAEAPERFRITPLLGGEPLWRLKYNATRFSDR